MAIVFKTVRVVLDVVVPFEQAVEDTEAAEDALVDEVTDAFQSLAVQVGMSTGHGPGKVTMVSQIKITGEVEHMPG